jgi:murein DD-endopeptidase MepM/ murein hydrolase activator NlpD
LKRALKNNMKAVLENTPNEDVPVDNLNAQNLKVNRRVRTQAAMIGLAISVGATSLLVTRQSDQAQAAEPVGNQNTASATPAAGDTAVKFATTNKLEIQATSNVSVPENPVIVEPTAISQVPGLGAKWQVAQIAPSASVPNTMATERTSVQPTKGQRIASAIAKAQTAQLQASVQVPVSYNVALPQANSLSATAPTVSQTSDINAQLKAQQEFAINRLQQKSDRLKQSLAKLRVDNQLPQVGTNQANLESFGDASKSNSVTNSTIPTAVVPVETIQPTASKVYEVKPGDTLAGVALRNGTSVSQIIKANNLVNPNDLTISQKLNIPVASANVTSPKTPVTPTVTPTVTPSNQSVASNVAVPTPAQFAVAATNTDSVSPASANSATINESTQSASTGMGGDSPVPKVFAEMQIASRTKQSKSNGLGRLKAEIEQLREKYRAQQSGQVVPVNSSSTAATIPVYRQNVAIPTIPTSNNIAIPVPTYRPNNPAIQIPVPSYSAQPVNPDYAANQYGRNSNNSRNARNNAIPVPSVNINTAETFGNLPRGTAVSPQLPPLAAVDRYLPRPIDENTPPLSRPSAPGNPSISAAYIWPAKGVLTSGFGQRWGRPHRGIDVANATGTPIYASADGVIEKAGWNNGGYGNLVEVRHLDGSMTRYGHNSKVLVQIGQQVRQGQTIALMGSTGFSTGPHTHFEIHASGKGAVNPIAFLPARI